MGLHPRCRQQNVSFSLPCRMVHLLFLCSFVVSTESDRDEPKHAGDLAGTRDELCSKENASLSRYGTLQVDPTSDLIMQSVVMPESEQQRQRVIAFNFDPIISPYGVFAKDEFESKAASFSERSNDELSDKEDFTAPKSEDVANGTPVHERAMDAAKIEEMQVAEDSVNLQGSSEDSSEISDDIRTANGMQQTEAEILAEEADDTRALLDGEHVARESLSNSLRAESTTDEKSNIQLEESISSDMPPTKPGKRELSSDVAKESIQNEGNNTDSYELYENVGGLDEKKVSDSGTTDVAGTEAVAVDEQEGDSMTQEDNLLLQNSTEITQTFDAENDPSGEVDQVLPIGTDTPIISHAGDLDIAGSKDTGRGEEAVTSQLDMDSESTDEQEDVVIPPRNNASEIVGQNNVEALSLSDKKEELAEEDNNTQVSASNVVEDFQKGESNPPSSKNATNGASDDSSNVKSITQPYGANVTSTSGAGESKSFTEEMSLVQSTNNVSSEDIDAEQTESGKEINGVIEKGDTENEKRTGEEGVIRDSSLLIELEVEEESTENVLKEGDTFDRYEESIPGEMTHEGEGSLHNTSPNEENTRDISQKQTLDIGQSDVSTATKNDRSEGDTPIINSAHIDFGGTSVKGSLEGLPGANEDSEATSTDLLEFSETESLGSPGKDGAPEFEATTLSIEDESILSDSASALKSPSKSASYDTVSTEETIPNTKDFSGGSKKPSVNDEFVLGLDDLHKFVEEVDPPDELDVGAGRFLFVANVVPRMTTSHLPHYSLLQLVRQCRKF